MSSRSDVAPDTLPVTIDPDGVRVEYVDGREAVYRVPPEPVEGAVRCQPGKDVHVLVTDATGTEGVMVYVNERKTHDSILESTGVGRVLLDAGEAAELLPGVTARIDGHAVEVSVDPAVTDGRVFVFEEDALGERAYELVP